MAQITLTVNGAPQTVEAEPESQLLYVLLMVFLGVLGTILYVAVPRPKLR